jgi:hypothetical protein
MQLNFKSTAAGVTFATLLLLASCAKTDLPKSDNTKLSAPVVMGAKAPDLAYDQLSSFPYGTDNIPAPWAGGIGRSFPVQYLDDYKPADGWELYYNTFNSATKAADPFFIIYNRYRGVLRIYYYLSPRSGAESDHVTFQLDLRGTVNQSSILNFEQGEVINHDLLSSVSSKVQNELIIQSGTWYAEEFELAYDQNLSSTSYVANQLRWSMYSTTVDKIDLEGTQKGTIDGTVQVPKPTTSFFGQLVKGAVSVGLGELGTLATGSKIITNFFSKGLGPIKLADIQKGVTEASTGALKEGGKSIFNAVLSQLKGSNGGSGFSEQKVNLKINTDITLSGNISHSPNGMFSPVVFISNTQGLSDIAPDFIPNYDSALGVFNISSTPTVNMFSITPPVPEPGGNPRLKTFVYVYAVDDASFTLQFNPAVQNTGAKGASIQNIKKEVILAGYNPLSITELDGTTEYVGTSVTALTGETVGITAQTQANIYNPPTNVYVRVSFDVVPNNGSAPIKIIKTFNANISKKF